MVSYDLNHRHQLAKPATFISYDRKTGRPAGNQEVLFPGQITERLTYFVAVTRKINSLRIIADGKANDQMTQDAKQQIGEAFPRFVMLSRKLRYRSSAYPLEYTQGIPGTIPTTGTVFTEAAAKTFLSIFYEIDYNDASRRLETALESGDLYVFGKQKVDRDTDRRRFPPVYRISDLIELQ